MADADKNANAEGADGKKKGSKKLMLILLAVLVLAGGGGAAWYFLVYSKSHDTSEAPPPVLKIEPPVYMPLEPLVINLADTGGDRFAQAGITFKLRDAKSADEVKKVLPNIRSAILMVLSQKKAEELLSREGKEKLAADIMVEVTKALGLVEEPDEEEEVVDSKGRKKTIKVVRPKQPPNPVIEILFASLIVQ